MPTRAAHPAAIRRITQRITASALMLLLCLMHGCATTDIEYDYDRTVDFSAFQTYTWDDALPVTDDALVRTSTAWPLTLQNTIRDELSARGLVEVSAQAAKAPAQLQVRYFGTADQTIAIRQVHNRDQRLGAQGDRNWRSRSGVYAHIGQEDYETQVRETGFLMIEMIDTRTGRMIWRATGSVDLHGAPDQTPRISRAVQQMLKNFPPDTGT